MSESDRRKFVRVLFEANFEVRSSEWTDKAATGLDISLNGCRFNCKQSISDGEILNIIFKPGLELEGIVRWCWPIEWYFQAALQFENIEQEKQASLKAYIEEVTGVGYLMQKDGEIALRNTDQSVEILQEDLDDIDDLSASIIDPEDHDQLSEDDTEDVKLEQLPALEEDSLNLDIEDPIDNVSDFYDEEKNQRELSKNGAEEDDLEELPPLEEEDLLNLDMEEPIDSASDFTEKKQDDEFFNEFNDDINVLSFAGKQVVLYDMEKDQAELLIQYLSERARMVVEYVTKKENLWRLLKIDPMDIVILETDSTVATDALEIMQQTKDQFPGVGFICLSGPVSLERRLQFLNAGALDYLTRPMHLSTIAQSVLVHLSHTEVGDFVEDIIPEVEMMASNRELQEELTSMTEQRDEARADAKANAAERDDAIAETKQLERRAQQHAEEKESLYFDENFIPDAESIPGSAQIDPEQDLNGVATLLDEDLKISEEVDLIEEDY